MVNEHGCHYLSDCCGSEPTQSTVLIFSGTEPVGWCGGCGEAFSFSCEDIANDACPIENLKSK
jgi:hypothetical protein